MRSSQEKAQAAILYHATQGRIVTNKIKDSEVVMSLDEENPLRLSVYRKAVGVECAVVEKADMEGQNGVIHVVNRVMIAANISAGDLLRREGNFKSVFCHFIQLDVEILKNKNKKTGLSWELWSWWWREATPSTCRPAESRPLSSCRRTPLLKSWAGRRSKTLWKIAPFWKRSVAFCFLSTRTLSQKMALSDRGQPCRPGTIQLGLFQTSFDLQVAFPLWHAGRTTDGEDPQGIISKQHIFHEDTHWWWLTTGERSHGRQIRSDEHERRHPRHRQSLDARSRRAGWATRPIKKNESSLRVSLLFPRSLFFKCQKNNKHFY